MPVVLWTDALIWLLVMIITGFVFYARRHEHLKAPWRQVAQSRAAMISAVILSFFVVIGLLDSLHYYPQAGENKNGETQYQAEMISVFDRIMDPIRLKQETTYSAPFATHAYAKETIELPDGTQVRRYPRLEHGGGHLDDPEKAGDDIAARAAKALGEGLLWWIWISGFIVIIASRRAGLSWREWLKRRCNRRDGEMPVLAMLLTFGAVVVLGVIAWRLGTHYHIMGTDKVGQDVFYEALKSIRTGLMIGTLTTLVMLPFAILLGISAAYFRGWVDDLIQYMYITLSSIPSVLLIAAAILMLQVYMANNPAEFSDVAVRSDMRLLFLCMILGITSWTSLSRLLRAETLKLREYDYIQAAQAFGVGHFSIITRHILPNVMHIVLITVVLDFSGLVLAEAVLSYVNIGVDPTMSSWGNMINSARLEMAREPIVWWSLAAAFVFMFALVLAANLFSDAVRDAFDPRLRK